MIHLHPRHAAVPFAAALILATSQLSAVMAVSALVVGPSIDVSRFAGDNESETTVAVNPTNPNNVVVVSNFAIADALMKSVSVDGGAHWSTTTIADGSTDLGVACCDPNGAFDTFGNYFLVYLDLRAKKVQTAYSTDGGANLHFLATIDHTDNSSPASNGKKWGSGTDQPSLATGPDGSGHSATWFVYKPYSTGGQRLTVRGLHVTGHGVFGAWSKAETVPGPKDGSFGDIAVGPDGQVLTTYQDNTSGQGASTIWTNVDPDGFGSAGFGPARAATATNVGGFDYIPPQSHRSVDAEAGLAYDRSGGAQDGRVYLVYTNETPDESNDTNIYVRYSDDDGATWSSPVRVNDDAGTNSQFNPHIAIDQATGFIAVGFHDARNDLGQGLFGAPGDTNGIANDDAQYWVTVSTTGGASFLSNVQVSAGTSNAAAAHNGIDYGDYTGLGFAGGVIHPAWADNSNSDGHNPDGALHKFDVYSAAITVP